ncbi:unnamed protein product [Chironomus riparius]|uniref:Uncharacterized protein n=1 Tax=Chironomus riparius TaxID=315576 RepID=A0A9N9WYT2_9DIPT|nr:unnamed protein product [Chironomus riparius]
MDKKKIKKSSEEQSDEESEQDKKNLEKEIGGSRSCLAVESTVQEKNLVKPSPPKRKRLSEDDKAPSTSSTSRMLAKCKISDDNLNPVNGCLEITMITSGWFVGIEGARTEYLKSLIGTLKHLKIQQLPYDFDGGEVLKYIIEDMKLETFYYGDIPLILNGQKQDVKEFSASETQITSAIEMIRQFSSIRKITLYISATDISSEDIEEAINSLPMTTNNIEEFTVIDTSRGSFGVFRGLFKHLVNLKMLTLITNDRCINTILKGFPIMPDLKEIQLSSTAPNALDRYETIKIFAPHLEIIKVVKSCANDAYISFGGNIQVSVLDDANAPGGSQIQRPNEGERNRESGDETGDGDGNKDEESGAGSSPQATPSKYPEITIQDRDFPIRSSFAGANIYDVRKLYVHACGHAKNIINDKNYNELNNLIANDEFENYLTVFNVEEGKFVFEFGAGRDDYPNQLRAKMDKLAYQLNDEVQLALLTLSSNPRVIIKLYIDKDWNDFLTAVPCYNNPISSSLWKKDDNSPPGSFIILVDALSYYQIRERGSQLNINGLKYEIKVEINPFEIDVAALEAHNI